MGIRDRLMAQAAVVLIERPAGRLSLADLADSLEENGRQIEERLAQAQDNPANRDALCHIVGIERWGQSRLRVALGEPLTMDEYDGYRPASDLDWEALQAEFPAARQDTLALVAQLDEAGAAEQRVPHNDFGQLSARGWLFYLNMHAKLEGRRVKASKGSRVGVLSSGTVVQIPVAPWLNVFLLRGEGGAVLVDTGLKGQADLILERLAEHGVLPQDVRLILITHGHGDHFGSAAELHQRTGAPVAVHALDADALRRGAHDPKSLRATNKLVELLMNIPGTQFAGQAIPVEPDIVFEDEWHLDEYGVAGRVVPTPGHTPGSVSVVLDSGEVVLGDMVMGALMGLLPKPGAPLVAWDLERNWESLRQLAALSPPVIYASHGGPFRDLSGVGQGQVDWRGALVALGVLAGLVFVWRLLRGRRGASDSL